MEYRNTAYVFVSNQLKIISYNELAEKFSQEKLQKEAKIGAPILQYLPAERKEKVHQWMMEVLEGKSIQYEINYPSDGGSKIWFSIELTPIPNNFGMMVSITDTTHRRRTEDVMNLTHTVVEHTHDAILISDIRVKDNPIIYANHGFCNLTGYSKAEVLGKNCRFLKGDETSNGTIYKIEKSLDYREYFEGEILTYKKDGTAFWNYLRITPLPDENGEITHFVGFLNDISNKKNMEMDTLEKNEQLRQLSLHIQNKQEDERSKIAVEIQDDLGHQLLGIKLELVSLKSKTEKEFPHIAEKTSSMINAINQTLETVREISTELRPRILDELGLEAAIAWQIDELNEITIVNCVLHSPGLKHDYTPEINTAVYRIFEETLADIIQNSEATQVIAELIESKYLLTLKIWDNGKALPGRTRISKKSIGLLALEERAMAANGLVALENTGDSGTCLTLKISLL